nr:FGGY family carbohydrate kinase [Pedobacter sp. SYP-B3415]
MYSLGIDLGTSSVKVAIVELESRKCVCNAQFPDIEAPLKSLQPGWAEQDPEDWWRYTQQAIRRTVNARKIDASAIAAIGISYQMHGLVLVDSRQQVLRDSIIWCDSRAVQIGDEALSALGSAYQHHHLLNSPGNFTASKFAWVKRNEPQVYAAANKMMLPGDFIAMKLTGACTTTVPGLSEGIFWDFKTGTVSEPVMRYFGFDGDVLPEIRPVFSEHGLLDAGVADLLGLRAGIPVSYKSGDQPNNALSLNVMKPGAVAATAGTSGVIYGVSDQLSTDPLSRINTFAHVNHRQDQIRTGVLLCINGTGSMYRWARDNFAPGTAYSELNRIAATAAAGSRGLYVFPFGNGAERMLGNRSTGARLSGIDLNLHGQKEIFRAVHEGIVFAFRYGLDIMKASGLKPAVIRAGHANLFQSKLFAQTFVDVTGVPVELFANDGSVGAAIGAAIGAGLYSSEEDAFAGIEPLCTLDPQVHAGYEPLYQQWKAILENEIESTL